MSLNGFWESLEVGSAVSRLNQALTQQAEWGQSYFERWSGTPLATP
jgi:hypothetical protein